MGLLVGGGIHEGKWLESGVLAIFGRGGDALRTLFPSLRATLVVPGAAGNVIHGDPTTEKLLHGDADATMVGKRLAENVAAVYRKASRKQVSKISLAKRRSRLAISRSCTSKLQVVNRIERPW